MKRIHSAAASFACEDLEALVQSTRVPIAVFDAECRYTFVNEALAQVSRMSIAEHVGRSVDDIAPDVAEFTRAVVGRVLDTGRMETVAMNHGGSTGMVASYFRFSSRRDGAPKVGVMCVPTWPLEESPTDMWRARLAFEALLSKTSARLLSASPDSFNGVFRESLRDICESQLYPSAMMIRFDGALGAGEERRASATVTHAWHRPEICPAEGRPLPEELVSWLAGRRLASSSSRKVPLSDVPESLSHVRRALIQAQPSIAHIACFPFSFDGALAGAAVFVVCADDADPYDTSRRLRLLSDLLTSALLRNEKERASSLALERTSRQEHALTNERDSPREENDRDFVHASAAMRQVLELARTVAVTPATALVRGESGVGKELVAGAIHKASPRRDMPLVKVNCASIPRELFESEFFGHTRGAFTGALRDRVGRFELAHGGTLFLDEIGEIPLAEQAKLLRVIQEGEFERVGEERTRRVDVRIIAATNRRLERDVEAGRFRRDLYFRLNVFPIDVPPLRERPEDVVLLAEHFIATYSGRIGRKGLTLSKDCREKLAAYAWPGNVRELANVIERSVILAKDRFQVLIPTAPPSPSSFPRPLQEASELRPPAQANSFASLRQMEAEMIEEALRASAGRISGKGGAAERLGLNPSTLRDRIKALGLRH